MDDDDARWGVGSWPHYAGMESGQWLLRELEEMVLDLDSEAESWARRAARRRLPESIDEAEVQALRCRHLADTVHAARRQLLETAAPRRRLGRGLEGLISPRLRLVVNNTKPDD